MRVPEGWLDYPAAGPYIRPLLPIKVSTSLTSSYLTSSYYDHWQITFNGLRIINIMLVFLVLILTAVSISIYCFYL